MNVNFTIRKLNGMIFDMEKATTVDERIDLKNRFCSELAKLLEEFETSDSVASKSIAEVYLTEVKNGNYIKALDCLEYLEGANKDLLF